MKCRAVEPLLSEYVDNRLSARETISVERHLAECHACTRALNELRRTIALVAALPESKVSEDFMSGLQARLQGLEPAPAPHAWVENLRGLFRPRLLPVLGLAGASAALAAILLIPRHVPEPVTPFKEPVV